MDSRLLNVVYDDTFDDNYVKYDNDTEFWSSGSETMGMQLTETLNGILPIAPTEDFHRDDYENALNLQNSKNAFNYEGFAGHNLTTNGEIEIVTVDPNTDGYDTDSENEEDSDDNNDDNTIFLDFERQSQCSNATFRSRTDSSSIGDYESHTSDYDDDEDDYDDISINNTSLMHNDVSKAINKTKNSIVDLHSNLVAPDDLFLDTACHKSRKISTNTLNSDIDGLGLQIDGSNFDLAEFITKDDFNVAKNKLAKNIDQTHSVLPVITTAKDIDSDSDSDIIVDVETVEIDEDEDEASSLRKASKMLNSSSVQQIPQETEEETLFVDNVKLDPSWSPTSTTKRTENYKVEQKTNFIRNFPLVPNKKQCDLLKGKFAKSKGKTLQKFAKAPAQNIKIKNSPIKQYYPITTSNSENILNKIGVGMGGKYLALLKHDCIDTSERSSDNNKPLKSEIFHSSLEEQKSVTLNRTIEENSTQMTHVVKKKLNLAEYKKRRNGDPLTSQANSKFVSCKIPKFEDKTANSQTNYDKRPPIKTQKHSEAVTSIVKTLKEQQYSAVKNVTDPITEAKNKVLRMQELKKAQQMRIIDTTISAKVPRVTKLLPLRDIVKDTPYVNEEKNKLFNSQSTKSDYEEIIIVSVCSNTEISIPPTPIPGMQQANKATRTLLKSSALLSTITNTFQKVKASDHTKLSTSSLIASIQDVIVKKTLPVEEALPGKDINDAKKPEHHGEDKIIMHLRKDRIRKRMCSIGIQTDLQPEFPPLPLPKARMLYKSRERTSRHRKRQYRKKASSSSSELSDDQSITSSTSTISRSRNNSCSSSLERMRTYDSAIGTGGYSSRSSFKHHSSISSSYSESADRMASSRRQRRTSYTKRSAARRRSRSSYSSSSYTSDSDRSPSPYYRRSRSRSNSRTRSRSRRSSYRKNQNNFVDRNVSQPAVEERRIVYVGRIEQETTKDILRRKFLQYGTIKQISIHFKDTGMKYGFVTFEHSEDAFAAIDNSTRDPQINMYDVSFGGRRAFCRASYADLDNAGINAYQSYVFPQPLHQRKEEDSFEALLMKMKAKLNANKTNTSTKATTGSDANAVNCQNKATNKI